MRLSRKQKYTKNTEGYSPRSPNASTPKSCSYLKTALKESGMLKNNKQQSFDTKTEKKLKIMLTREQELFELIRAELPKIKIPKIDLIAVDQRPGA